MLDQSMIEYAHPGNQALNVNPFFNIRNWYDVLEDPFQVIKNKCKPTSPTAWEEFILEEVYYIAWVFTEDKINSPSFADDKDTVLNNIILDSNGELLQMYFMTNRNSEALSQKWMFKICVREYKKWKEVIARKFIWRLQ